MYVEPGDRLAQLADLSRVCLDLEAYERDLPWLALGQEVEFTVQSLPGRTFQGRIGQINPMVDPVSRTTLVRIWVGNPDRRLVPGMFGRGLVTARLGGPDGVRPVADDDDELPLLIPATAALITGQRAIVYVQIPDTERPTFELRDVLLGPRAGDFFIVREGLAEGEVVVTNGNFKIDAELQLRGRPSMMSPPSLAPIEEAVPFEDPRAAPVAMAEPDEIPVSFGQGIAVLAARYIDLTEALAADDGDAARTAAAAMLEQLEEVDPAALPEEQENNWHGLAGEMREALVGMVLTLEISEVRGNLQQLTTAMETAIASYHAHQVPPLYRAFCPMVPPHGIGTWLQTARQINNPYHGSAMLRCGEIIGPLL